MMDILLNLNIIFKLYLSGVVFNLIFLFYEFVRGYKEITLNIQGAILFIILGWLVYPFVFIKTKIS